MKYVIVCAVATYLMLLAFFTYGKEVATNTMSRAAQESQLVRDYVPEMWRTVKVFETPGSGLMSVTKYSFGITRTWSK